MLYNYQKREFSVKKSLVKEDKNLKKIKIKYKSFIKTSYKKANKVIAYFYLPKKIISSDTVIILHGMRSHNHFPANWYSKRLAQLGIPTYAMILPNHFERTPKGYKSGIKFLTDKMVEAIKDFQQAVIDVRTSIDWLEAQSFCKNISIMGISFGGMIAIISMGVDKRIKKGIFLMTGGNYFQIVWNGLGTKIFRKIYLNEEEMKKYGCTYNNCKALHQELFNYIKKLNSPTDLDKTPVPKKCFLFDPLTFAQFIKKRKVLMYNAFLDQMICRKAQEQLWKELGKPERHHVFAGHLLSLILHRYKIINRINSFIKYE